MRFLLPHIGLKKKRSYMRNRKKAAAKKPTKQLLKKPIVTEEEMLEILTDIALVELLRAYPHLNRTTTKSSM